MKIAITGASGTLGQYVSKIFLKENVLPLSHRDIDVSDPVSVRTVLTQLKPDVVIHLAALTNVDYCETHPDEADRVNALGTKNVAEACLSLKSKMVYVSTAAVFPGTKGLYDEDDKPDPVNVYGKSKLLGEQYILDILPGSCILRIAWLIGGGKKERKFISYVMQNIQSKKEQMRVVSDIKGSIAYAQEVAEFILFLMRNNRAGIYHFGSKGTISRVDIAQKIVLMAGSSMKIVPMLSSYFAHQFIAPRPMHESLISRKIPFKTEWTESLTQYYQSELV